MSSTEPESSALPALASGWVVLVPVKPPEHAKSRLVGVLDADRTALAEAFALDTVAAAVAAREVRAVLVVTDDARLAARVRDLGADAVPDGSTHGLNDTLRQAAAEARRRHPDALLAALCGDLPALRSADLDLALGRLAALLAAAPAAIVPDADGTGTCLYAAAAATFAPRFGGASRAAHADIGAVEPDLAGLDALRRDVDDLLALRAALAHGVGPATRAVAARLGLVG
ncbi:2-phospho-L-lactate guanylyltransferase [Nocardioides sp. TRM66260-LWL]|uniref:2-phospho-L-lactate guanylyltransferase n=1 Tax=Nocardioides sp. TRM66260-LWL TaxID=2874478 RepID=UPI001CC67CE6|nr:2-phospho-L-lactate guanylyltransferase [Nocardioides sp. TRM66260-LWL]MBZ5733129.1 2-phospho-L-lactate guanylyltransferase [Nocardioides sp. TRM66260-LWL]